VLKVWSKRYRDLRRARTRVACRLHAVLAELVPGGFGKEITARQDADLLRRISPSGPAARARCELAAELLAGLRRLDAQRRDTRTGPQVARVQGHSARVATMPGRRLFGPERWYGAIATAAQRAV
jgi:hypothetical protein